MAREGTIIPVYSHDRVSRPLHGIEQVQDTILELDLAGDQFLVIGGAAMVLYGVKALTPDVDILVSESGWSDLVVSMDHVVEADPPQRAIDAGADNKTLKIAGLTMPVEATESVGDGHYPLSFDKDRSVANLILDRIPCLPIDMIRASKQALIHSGGGRAGDRNDIGLINTWLIGNNHPNRRRTIW